MTQTQKFIQRLEALKEAERSRLRRLAGKPLDENLECFDLFTGLWWPLRKQSQAGPRRETSWLIAKLYGSFPITHVRAEKKEDRLTLPRILASCEPRDEHSRKRFRRRVDSLLLAPLFSLEPHLQWALSVVADGAKRDYRTGLDWVQLLDDLSIWDRGAEHRRSVDIREEWASQYFKATRMNGGTDNAY
jgi:hypothetical protein